MPDGLYKAEYTSTMRSGVIVVGGDELGRDLAVALSYATESGRSICCVSDDNHLASADDATPAWIRHLYDAKVGQ